ncbi:hypothetical protein M3Y98_00312200 [Aphelenchoides besseyi]|nr:hypothetical protein M3Y98_00312200 [Aphelenchoides besseyi]KAI6201331.1 hypothetical protein M3Y96_00830400 [Aphelenchoides besseyi]
MRFVGSSKLRSEDKTVDTKTELDATNFIVCSVFFLDDYEHKFQLPKTAIGEELLNEVFTFLELTERDYFGLQFVCVTGSHSIVRMKWLDGKKSIKRQMMTAPYHLFFRLKFYPSDPTKLCEELTLYHIYLQVRKDLADGRLPCNSEEMAAILGSYAAQSEFGDYSSSEQEDNYLASFRLLPTQTPGLLKKIREMHALRVGQSPAEAEFHFLTKAKCLDLYGFDLFQSKDGFNRSITIGVNSNGISVFDNNSSRVHSFPWATIIKLSFKRKNFLLQILTADENADRIDTELSFNAISAQNCKMLWKSCIEHHSFFRLVKPPNANVNVVRSLFHLQSRFRYSGRTEYQTMEENRRRGLNGDRQFARPSNLQVSRPSTKNRSAISSTESVSTNDEVESNKVNGRRPRNNQPSTAKPTKLEQSASSTISPTSTDTINGSSSINSGSESVTPSLSKQSKRHSVVFNGTIPDPSTLPPTILQQPPVDHPRSRVPANSALATSLQTLSLSAENPNAVAIEQQQQPTTTRRSWNAVSLTPQLSEMRHQARAFDSEYQQSNRLSHSPSPYDSASLIINSSIVPSVRNRGAVYSMSDDETNGGTWQSFRGKSTIFNDNNQASSSSSQLSNGAHQNRQRNGNHNSVQSKGSRNSLLINGQNGAPYRYDFNNGQVHVNGAHSSSSSSNGGSLNNNSPHLSYGYSLYSNNNARPPVPSLNGRSAYEVNNHNLSSTMSEFPTYLTTPAQRRSANGVSYDSSPTQNSTSSSITDGPILRTNGIMPNNSGRLKALYGEFIASANATKRGLSTQRAPSTSPASNNSEDGYVLVRMQPDSQGRFGFNVTGGTDTIHPVIISRISAGSAADRCFPRLNEGDQVIKINGQDISTWSYSNVVNFIRSLRNYGEMTLTVKPNVYRYGELDESENRHYSVPEAEHVSEAVPRSHKLAQSLRILKESLDSGTITKQFELLYRKKPGMSMDDSDLSTNVGKNRYRDIRPYDSTRVILERAPSGDYINASHVNMEIPNGILNSYIATQGPLPHTAGDFWTMVWEQSSTNIVMLTTLVEKDRVKCHQYWPNRKESVEYGQLVITNISERSEQYCYYRELSVRNKMKGEERLITQMQYTAWPDHGVPEDAKHFIDFVGEVRAARNGSLDPIIVHCSAGIGRTGVLILMETAACLIEGNEPVYPLDVVRTMRDQRAMLIQTVEQYTFVCRCIIQAYNQELLKPLAEYQKAR